ncbi:MAG: hypothetical protein V1821_04575 [bacterium]
MKKLFATLAVLALFGAGCGVPQSTTTPEQPKAPVEQPAAKPPTAAVPSTPTVPATSGEVRTLTPAMIDSTWRTYTSKALGFSMDWPTKGRYAPEWEVKIYSTQDQQIKDGCYVIIDESTGGVNSFQRVSAGGQNLCHSSLRTGDYKLAVLVDAYATTVQNKVAVIHFTKSAWIPSVAGIENCAEELSSNEKVCVPFKTTDYYNMLDGIVGTFQLNPAQ